MSLAHYDIPGALTVTLGLVALVYGFTKAETTGWASSTTVALLAVAVILLATFVTIEMRSAHPLLPLRVVLDRNRGGSFLASLLVGAALFGMFLFLSYYLQGTLHYSALKSGFAFLPFSVGIIASAGLASSLLPRFGPRNLMVIGLGLATVGMAWFTQIAVGSSYAVHVLPAEIVMSIGMGLVFVPLSSTALVGVADHDAGVASALVNTTQQVGGSLGTALLNTIAASATASYLVAHHGATAVGLVHGYTTAFDFSAVLLAIGLVATLVLVRAGRDDIPADDAALVMA